MYLLSYIDNIGMQFILAIIIYFYLSYCVMILSQKNGKPGGIWSFIPIANIFILIGAAKKPYWLFILFFIPLINIVVMIYIWMEIAKLRNHPYWLGILIILPIADLILPGYLAFVDKATDLKQPKGPQQPQPPQPMQ